MAITSDDARAVMRRVRSAVGYVLRTRSMPTSLADDVVSEALIIVCSRWDPCRSSLLSFATTATWWAAAEVGRKTTTALRLERVPYGLATSPETLVVELEDARAVAAYVAELGDDDRALLLEGETLTATARARGCSLSTVSRRRHKLVNEIRGVL